MKLEDGRVIADRPQSFWSALSSPLVVYLLGITAAVFIWGVRLDSRMTEVERRNFDQGKSMESTLALISSLRERTIVIEERQRVVIDALASQTRKIDLILDQNRARASDIQKPY